MCCEGLHDVQAKLDQPGEVRFVTICARCGREQRELWRRAYRPAPRLFAGAGSGPLPLPAAGVPAAVAAAPAAQPQAG